MVATDSDSVSPGSNPGSPASHLPQTNADETGTYLSGHIGGLAAYRLYREHWCMRESRRIGRQSLFAVSALAVWVLGEPSDQHQGWSLANNLA